MDKAGAEAIIDTIKALIHEAEALDAPAEDGTIDTLLVLQRLKKYMGEYLGVKDPLPPSHLLTARNLTNCKNYLTTNPAGYYVALELLDIDTWPLDCIIQVYRERDLHTGDALFSRVTNFVSEMKQWVNGRTIGKSDVFSVPREKADFLNVPRKPAAAETRQENVDTPMSDENFDKLFDRKTPQHIREKLVALIKESVTEKQAHTYIACIAANSQPLFRQDSNGFGELTRAFLALAGLDPTHAENIRQTKLSEKKMTRAKAAVEAITKSRKRNP